MSRLLYKLKNTTWVVLVKYFIISALTVMLTGACASHDFKSSTGQDQEISLSTQAKTFLFPKKILLPCPEIRIGDKNRANEACESLKLAMAAVERDHLGWDRNLKRLDVTFRQDDSSGIYDGISREDIDFIKKYIGEEDIDVVIYFHVSPADHSGEAFYYQAFAFLLDSGLTPSLSFDNHAYDINLLGEEVFWVYNLQRIFQEISKALL
jgi:hypothetical protein